MTETRTLLKVVRVVSDLGADFAFVESLVEAEVIHLEYDREGEALISPEDAERLRLVQLLTQEMDVNLPGVEVILHMREDMMAMQKQFAEILDEIAKELRTRGGRRT